MRRMSQLDKLHEFDNADIELYSDAKNGDFKSSGSAQRNSSMPGSPVPFKSRAARGMFAVENFGGLSML